MKKAQLQHVFLYLFALVVIGALVIIGYKSITKITAAGCDAGKETFKSELLSLIDQYDSRGSQHLEKLSVPCGFNKLCFLDSDAILKSVPISTNQLPKIIQDAQSSQAHTNLWINQGTSWEAVGWSEKVEVGVEAASGIDPNWICISAKGNAFNVQFNGLGRRTRVSIPTP